MISQSYQHSENTPQYIYGFKGLVSIIFIHTKSLIWKICQKWRVQQWIAFDWCYWVALPNSLSFIDKFSPYISYGGTRGTTLYYVLLNAQGSKSYWSNILYVFDGMQSRFIGAHPRLSCGGWLVRQEPSKLSQATVSPITEDYQHIVRPNEIVEDKFFQCFFLNMLCGLSYE